MVDARLEAPGMASSGGGPMILPLLSAHEWRLPSWAVKCQTFLTMHIMVKADLRVPNTTGLSSWDKLLQEMDKKKLDSVGAINQQAGIPKEK